LDGCYQKSHTLVDYQKKKAEDLYVEYIEIISRDRMTLDDSIRINEIASRLTDAGYTIVEEGNSRPLLYPRYAGSIARIL